MRRPFFVRVPKRSETSPYLGRRSPVRLTLRRQITASRTPDSATRPAVKTRKAGGQVAPGIPAKLIPINPVRKPSGRKTAEMQDRT